MGFMHIEERMTLGISDNEMIQNSPHTHSSSLQVPSSCCDCCFGSIIEIVQKWKLRPGHEKPAEDMTI
jgi:hypothetical protein